MRFLEQEKLHLGIRRKVGSKIRFRPKNREEKELRGENGAFDTETSRFPTAREVRSARKRPKSGKHRKQMVVVWSAQTQKVEIFEVAENAVIRVRSGRCMDRFDRAGLKFNFLGSVRSETEFSAPAPVAL